MVFQLFDTQYVEDGVLYLLYVAVALLRGGAWIEIMQEAIDEIKENVALLRGGAWIEISAIAPIDTTLQVALLRGGAWIEIATAKTAKLVVQRRTPSRGCVD